MDPATIYGLIDKGGTVAVLVVALAALAWVSRWLLKIVIETKDQSIAYRDAQIGILQGQTVKQQDQLTRQQDLFDQAMNLLSRSVPSR
jgi:hypothetical protein